MEGLLSTIIDNDALSLVVAVSGFFLCLVALMVYEFFNPTSSGNPADRKNSLRERNQQAQQKMAVGAVDLHGDALQGAELEDMQNEVALKEEIIKELSEKISELEQEDQGLGPTTNSGHQGATPEGGAQESAADNASEMGRLAELEEQIKSLQARLDEYAIIEDDIADLSLLKKQNKSLKEELDQLRQGHGGEGAAIESSDSQGVFQEPPPSSDPTMSSNSESDALTAQTTDSLVDEFEKIAAGASEESPGNGLVNSPEVGAVTQSGTDVSSADDYGSVMAAQLSEMGAEEDSKEEADLLISDFKSMRRGKAKNAS